MLSPEYFSIDSVYAPLQFTLVQSANGIALWSTACKTSLRHCKKSLKMKLDRILDHTVANVLSAIFIVGLLTQVRLEIKRDYHLNGSCTTTYLVKV